MIFPFLQITLGTLIVQLLFSFIALTEVTRENCKGYQDGLMDSLHIRVALLGPEGSG